MKIDVPRQQAQESTTISTKSPGNKVTKKRFLKRACPHRPPAPGVLLFNQNKNVKAVYPFSCVTTTRNRHRSFPPSFLSSFLRSYLVEIRKIFGSGPRLLRGRSGNLNHADIVAEPIVISARLILYLYTVTYNHGKYPVRCWRTRQPVLFYFRS